MKNWIEPEDVQVPEEFHYALGGHSLVSKILVRRGFKGVAEARAFLDPDYFTPTPSSELVGMAGAVERLEGAIKNGEPICVWGDFDVDGQTSTTLLVSALLELGGNVTYHIPLRQTESHGMNIPVLKKIIGEGIKVVLTCDTGIASCEEIDFAKEQGVDVIVTDHHDLPSKLPQAFAIVNPKMLPLTHPLRELPGVGCAYKVAEELYNRAGKSDESQKYLDLVALGIVSDIAVQTGDTRYLLKRGLKELCNTQRLGLRLIMENSGLKAERISAEHIGFAIGPRLNSLGRLADANYAVELLTTTDIERARILANQLEGLNARRKLLCDQVFLAAQSQIEKNPSLLDYSALILSHPSWPAGVLGIVASRLVEIYNKPAILISTPPGESGRGSARSVKGCNISLAIAEHHNMLLTFGGHPMAAGLSILPEKIPEFRRSLSCRVTEMLGEIKKEETLQIDSYLLLSDLSIELVEELHRLAPFGPGNPPLTFATRGLSIKGHSRMGQKGEHRQLIVEDNTGNERRVIFWHGASSPLPVGKFDLAYIIRASNYQGRREVNLEWIDTRPIEDAIPVIQTRTIDIVDYRQEPDPGVILKSLEEIPSIQIWTEGDRKKEFSGKNRFELTPSEVLVICTTPPGPVELQSVMDLVSPSKVYLFGINPQLVLVDTFLKHLTGLTKYALSKNDGQISISKMAAATAHREITVRKGIDWLLACGHITVSEEDDDDLLLNEGNHQTINESNKIASQLKELLAETESYRTYFARADKKNLLSLK